MKVAKTKLYALLLMSVYLPALLLSSLHTHEPPEVSVTVCDDCIGHRHHAGHLSALVDFHSCALCQFSHQSYERVSCTLPDVVVLDWIVDRFFAQSAPQLDACSPLSPRAPPILL